MEYWIAAPILANILIYFFIGRGVYLRVKKIKNLKQLKENYFEAIRNKDKMQALQTGRLYYAKCRTGFFGSGSGRLTIYDEQAIANDLSVI